MIFFRAVFLALWFCEPFSLVFRSGSSGFCEDMRAMYEYQIPLSFAYDSYLSSQGAQYYCLEPRQENFVGS